MDPPVYCLSVVNFYVVYFGIAVPMGERRSTRGTFSVTYVEGMHEYMRDRNWTSFY